MVYIIPETVAREPPLYQGRLGSRGIGEPSARFNAVWIQQ
jgi:hypothetical protein